MNIVYTDKLRAYMLRKGHRHIALEMYSPDFADAAPELVGKFLNDEQAQAFKQRKCHVFTGELGDVMIYSPGVELGHTLTLGLRSFFGITRMSLRCIMLFVVFAILTEPLFRYLTKFINLLSALFQKLAAKLSARRRTT